MTTATFPVTESTHVSTVRRAGSALAARVGFDEGDAGRVALVVSELATNLVKHARGGEILLALIDDRDRAGVDVLALDKGPGFRDFDHSAQDGNSTCGSLGHGLGAVRRQSDYFDLFSTPAGTVALARLHRRPNVPTSTNGFAVAGLSVPKPGEQRCGDDWAADIGPHRAALFVVDGLGHGPAAADAAAEAVAVFRRAPGRAPAALLDDVHLALRPTRGGAVGMAVVDLDRSLTIYAGIGNIAGSVVTDDQRSSFVSQNGTAGHVARRLQEFTYPIASQSTIVMQSDGLGTHWSPADYPGLWQRDPAIVAGVLYRDFTRRRDDVTVLVGRIGVR
ncbi:MAG TPA: ATP-binding SpoIIE family protein phosphatase [Vicinamibacterales bacterium]|jgi:anti-sigma regulatory factor (Ser/Thr protein kinase)|nr:ATP-binding SpoIIE family protein phosphatase [Vicinamibacterales bacterium]